MYLRLNVSQWIPDNLKLGGSKTFMNRTDFIRLSEKTVHRRKHIIVGCIIVK